MLNPDRRYLSGLMAAAVTLLPMGTDAQTMNRSSEELIPPAAAIVLLTDRTTPETRVPEVSFESSQPLTRASLGGTTLLRRWFAQDSALRARQHPGTQKRSWIARHPVLFGALVGFGGGFLIGYLPGDDGVFDDFTAGFNGWVLGGVGAGTGAAVGAIVGALRK